VLVVLIRVVNPAFPEAWCWPFCLPICLRPLIDHFVVQTNIIKRRGWHVANNDSTQRTLLVAVLYRLRAVCFQRSSHVETAQIINKALDRKVVLAAAGLRRGARDSV
jgi:hypothetical protein